MEVKLRVLAASRGKQSSKETMVHSGPFNHCSINRSVVHLRSEILHFSFIPLIPGGVALFPNSPGCAREWLGEG